LGLTFAGCFLGAGYVSGQEMWQFFGRFGRIGYLGLLLAVVFLSFVGIVMMRLTAMTGIQDTERLISEHGGAVLHCVIVAFELVFLVGISIIMTAGVGALGNELIRLPVWLCCAVFSAFIMFFAFAGLRGMVMVFSFTVPVLVAATVALWIYSVISNPVAFQMGSVTDTSNPLLRSWPMAALSFACYNMFCSVAIIAPLGAFLKNRFTAYFGIGFAALVLLTVALGVLASVNAAGTYGSELPMLSLALSYGKIIGLLYGGLLFLAMFGTCLSNTVAFLRIMASKWDFAGKHKFALYLTCALMVFSCSLFGFGDLIGVLYPIFGYFSSVFIVMLIIHFFRVKAKIKNTELKRE